MVRDGKCTVLSITSQTEVSKAMRLKSEASMLTAAAACRGGIGHCLLISSNSARSRVETALRYAVFWWIQMPPDITAPSTSTAASPGSMWDDVELKFIAN